MAESIGIASGIVALTVFAFNASVSLYETLKSFENVKKDIRNLNSELEALNAVLKSLSELSSQEAARFECLRLPLLHCGENCQGFEELIRECTKHSTDSKRSFRDWTKLQYRGKDIVSFKDMLAGFKATIAIAIGDANLRIASVNAAALNEFKEMLVNTTSDLEDLVLDLDKNAQSSRADDAVASSAENRQLREDIESLTQCLKVCKQASEHASQARVNIFEDVSAAEDADQVIVSTFGDLISAKQVSASRGAIQWLGGMSDDSLKEMIRQRGMTSPGRVREVESPKRQNNGVLTFQDQYGHGHKLH